MAAKAKEEEDSDISLSSSGDEGKAEKKVATAGKRDKPEPVAVAKKVVPATKPVAKTAAPAAKPAEKKAAVPAKKVVPVKKVEEEAEEEEEVKLIEKKPVPAKKDAKPVPKKEESADEIDIADDSEPETKPEPVKAAPKKVEAKPVAKKVVAKPVEPEPEAEVEPAAEAEAAPAEEEKPLEEAKEEVKEEGVKEQGAGEQKMETAAPVTSEETEVFVGNLPYTVNEDQVSTFFSGCGTVVNVKLLQRVISKPINYIRMEGHQEEDLLNSQAQPKQQRHSRLTPQNSREETSRSDMPLPHPLSASHSDKTEHHELPETMQPLSSLVVYLINQLVKVSRRCFRNAEASLESELPLIQKEILEDLPTLNSSQPNQFNKLSP